MNDDDSPKTKKNKKKEKTKKHAISCGEKKNAVVKEEMRMNLNHTNTEINSKRVLFTNDAVCLFLLWLVFAWNAAQTSSHRTIWLVATSLADIAVHVASNQGRCSSS